MTTKELIAGLREQTTTMMATGKGDTLQYMAADRARRRLEAIVKAWEIFDAHGNAEYDQLRVAILGD